MNIGKGGVGVHHGLTFNFGSPKVCSPFIFETCFSHDKHIWIAVTDYALLHKCAISIDSYSPINKFYSVIIFSVLINAVILLLNCLVLILYLYIIFTPQPLRAVGVLFSPMVSGWAGGK